MHQQELTPISTDRASCRWAETDFAHWHNLKEDGAGPSSIIRPAI